MKESNKGWFVIRNRLQSCGIVLRRGRNAQSIPLYVQHMWREKCPPSATVCTDRLLNVQLNTHRHSPFENPAVSQVVKIPRFLWFQQVQYHVHKTQSLVHILSQISPIHIMTHAATRNSEKEAIHSYVNE